MEHRLTRLWIRALRGRGEAYRRLGLIYIRGNRQERILAVLCLEKAMGMGDEKSLFIYGRYVSKGRGIIDDRSYRDMLTDYRNTRDQKKRRQLRQYLGMGTVRQKRMGV